MRLVKLIGMVAVAAMLTAGCGGAGGGPSSSSGSEQQWAQGKGEVPAQIGSSDVVHSIDGLPADSFEMWKTTGHAAPTGAWFFHNGQGKLGYTLPFGPYRAGDDVDVAVSTPSGDVKVDRDMRVRLSEWGNEAVPVFEETVRVGTVQQSAPLATIRLPDAENAAYIVSIEVLTDSGDVEDTLVSHLYTPVEEINAALKTDSGTYNDSAAEAKLVLENAGPTTLFFGTPYTIEKKVGDAWRIVPSNTAFTDIGIMLPPGRTHEQQIDISSLGSGEYRVIKQVKADGFELNADLAAPFTIE